MERTFFCWNVSSGKGILLDLSSGKGILLELSSEKGIFIGKHPLERAFSFTNIACDIAVRDTYL